MNQDFWHRNKDELGRGLNPFEERYKTLLQNVTNWNNPQNYYEKIHTIGQIKELIHDYANVLLTDDPKIIGFLSLSILIFGLHLSCVTYIKVSNTAVKMS